MAGKEVELKIKAELETAAKDKQRIQNAGGFSGQKGAKALNAVESLLEALTKVDVNKLNGTALTNFLNQVIQLRKYLDSAAKSLSNFSAEYQKALKNEEKAILIRNQAQDKLNASLEKNKSARASYVDKVQKSDYQFFYKDSGKTIPKSYTNVIADEYQAGNLKIIGKNGKNVTGLDGAIKGLGLDEVVKSDKEVEQFRLELVAAKNALKEARQVLKSTNKGQGMNPVTADVLGHSNDTNENVANLKEGMGEETVHEINNLNNSLNQLDVNTVKTTSSLGKAFKQFTLYAIALRAVKKAMREAISTIKELDRALTEQAMVTGLTRKQTYELLKDYQAMASRLGTTTKEVSSTMTQFLRQGRSIAESTKLTEAAVSAAKVAGISAADSINYLTTAINGFRLSANDAMKVSDKFAAVAASAAASYEEVAIALSKVAAQANLAGMSIDYTTALLTKGIETTREAPETIGTALKTIIARMRELGDYGKTLEGDMDLNNVESQLAYIGIALRDDNGELRSTEAVLNDLGKKWDTLNANQQAAVAKALAGTRQQSRLIAMMQDYERVTELQEIAQRSAGATMAQMATYMEGLDAAMNKVSVAWENLVSNLVNSDGVIAIVQLIGSVLQTIADNLWLLIPVGIILVAQGVQILNQKVREAELVKLQLQYAKDNNKLSNQQALIQAKNNREKQRGLVAQLKNEQSVLNTLKAQGKLSADQEKRLAELEEQIPLEEKKVDLFEQQITFYTQEQKLLDSQSASVSDLTSLWGGLGSAIANVFLMAIPGLQSLIQQTRAYIATQKAEEQQAQATSRVEAAGSGAKIPYVGWIIWAIIMGSAVIAAVYGAIKTFSSLINNTSESINNLSKEIFDLNKKGTTLDSVISKFDDLDKKILKTSSDIEEMTSLLDSAADSLSDSEQEIYKSLSTTAAKREFLESVRNSTNSQLATKRAEQTAKVLKLHNSGKWNSFKTSTKAEDIQARDAIYALNNAQLYKYIDETNELNEGTEELVQNLLEQLDLEKAIAILQNPESIKDYILQVQKGVEVFMDESKSLRERKEAYEELHSSLTDPQLREALEKAYSEWETFASVMSGDALDYMDAIGASVDNINALGNAIQKVGYNTQQAAGKINDLFETLQSGVNIRTALTDLFGFGVDSDEYNAILDAYDKAFGTTILNMGQNIDKFTNTIDSLYQKASEWNTLSETDKTSFLSENAALFAGGTGANLLKAFESGNYQAIHNALMQDDALSKQYARLLDDVNRQIAIEEARGDEYRDYAYLAELKQYKEHLEDMNKVFLASLKLRYEQQENQLSAYKDFLQKQTDALTEALEKRKDAYQKYFDEINKQEDIAEYDKKAEQLIENISRLGSSQNADAIAKRADLAKQLEELEQERLKELRTQAQEAMIKSIEDEVTRISDNLEKLLNNEQALLTAMTTDAQTPDKLIASLVSAQFASGNNTELGMQSYLQQMQATFAAIMPNVDWSQVDVERQGDSLILNIMGQTVTLSDTEQQTIYEAIESALRQLGYN